MPPQSTNPKASHQEAIVAGDRAIFKTDAEDGTTTLNEPDPKSQGNTTTGILTAERITNHEGIYLGSELDTEHSRSDISGFAQNNIETDEAIIPGEAKTELMGKELDMAGNGTSSSKITKRKKGRVIKKNVSLQRPGFQAFAKQSEEGNEKEDIAKYRGLNKAIEPQTGIHSQAWADAVIPQTSHLLKLPLDIRTMIFSYVFASFKNFQRIEPHRRGNSYWDPTWLNASDETNGMNLICKRIYLDVDTWGWLYHFKTFIFPGHGLLRQFLWAIKPSHKNAIRSIALKLRLTSRSKALNKTAFLALADLKNLTHLAVTVVFDWPVLIHVYSFTSVPNEYFDMVKQCKELKDLKGLMSFNLEMEFDYSFGPSLPLPDPSLEGKWTALEKDLRKVLIQKYHDEVRESNAKLRGSAASDQPAEADE